MSMGKKIQYVLCAEICIIFLLCITFVIYWKADHTINVQVTDWKSDFVQYGDESGWYVDENLVQTDQTLDWLYGPNIVLTKGTYSAKIKYHCDQNNACRVQAGGQNANLKTGDREVVLSKNFDQITYPFEVKNTIDDFELLIRYNGCGYLHIESIVIVRTATGLLRSICVIFALMVCLDLCIVMFHKFKKNKIWHFLFGIIILISLQLLRRGIGGDVDAWFHLMRIEGIAEELKMGHVPVKLSSIWMDGFGYPVSVYYGDLLLYFPAILRLLGFSVTAVYKLYIFAINVGTVTITYYCMKYVFREEKIALLTCLAYCTASFRLNMVFGGAPLGAYSAMMFLPMVAVAVYKIYTEEQMDDKESNKNSVLLAAGMSGLIGTHIISTQMVVIMLLVVALSMYRQTFKKSTIKIYCMAVIETCVFCAYFIVPFLDYYINVPTKINKFTNALIQDRAASVTDYFSFFPGNVNTPGLVLMAAFVISVVFWMKGQANREIKALSIYSGLSLWMASDLFPWNSLASNSWIGKWLSMIQFPWRYVAIAIVFMTLLLGVLLEQVFYGEEKSWKLQVKGTIVLGCCLMVSFLLGEYRDTLYIYDGAELDTYAVVGGEYVREGTNIYALSSDIHSENMQEVVIQSKKGSSMELRCVASEQEGRICVPLFHYKGYHVTDEKGNEYLINDGYNNQIEFSVPAGFDGNIQIAYREPWYWRVSELISLLSILVLCIGIGINIHVCKRCTKSRSSI